ncbi:MAG: protein kinase [Myxococcales bacterium]|nr:protein kinase [Myxococcales bacterium]
MDTLRDIPMVRPPARGEMIRAGSSGGVYFMGDYLGAGAYGDVYECTDEWSNGLVAKVLRPAQSFEQMLAQWRAEVANLSLLRHPNITYIHDAFEHEGAFYLIIEKCMYSLDRILGRANPDWVPHVARDLLQALAFVHRHGHVHKDVHPGNVFVSLTSDRLDADKPPVATFKLGDLGIARLESDIRRWGTIMAQWMTPPEALDPDRFGVVGRPTDLYHAALLLVGVMRGEMYPFTQQEIVSGVPQQMALSLHSPYREAIAGALHPVVGRRTQTALEFWRELQFADQYALRPLDLESGR